MGVNDGGQARVGRQQAPQLWQVPLCCRAVHGLCWSQDLQPALGASKQAGLRLAALDTNSSLTCVAHPQPEPCFSLTLSFWSHSVTPRFRVGTGWPHTAEDLSGSLGI